MSRRKAWKKKPRAVYSYFGAPCPVVACGREMKELGFCAKHAQRFRRYGDPNYVTPESARRVSNRKAQLKNKKAKPSSYLKKFGRHLHRLVMEESLGRSLKRTEIVHHIDGNKHNNRLKNLKLMTQSQHIKLHLPEMWAIKIKKAKQ